MRSPYDMHTAASESALRRRAEHAFDQSRFHRRGLGGIIGSAGHDLAWGFGINKHIAGHWEAFGIGVGSKGAGNNYWRKTGVHAGRATSAWGAKGVVMKSGGMFLGPLMTTYIAGGAIKRGYDEGGLTGALGAVPEAALWEVGGAVAGTAVRRAFAGGGTGIKALGGELATIGRTAYTTASWAEGAGGVASAVGGGMLRGTGAIGGSLGRGAMALGGRAVMSSIYLAPVVAAAMYVNYTVTRAQRDIEAGHRSLGINTTSSLAAFNTKGAWTSRQMSVQAIQRSHLNSRSALGNEAAYMHRR